VQLVVAFTRSSFVLESEPEDVLEDPGQDHEDRGKERDTLEADSVLSHFCSKRVQALALRLSFLGRQREVEQGDVAETGAVKLDFEVFSEVKGVDFLVDKFEVSLSILLPAFGGKSLVVAGCFPVLLPLEEAIEESSGVVIGGGVDLSGVVHGDQGCAHHVLSRVGSLELVQGGFGEGLFVVDKRVGLLAGALGGAHPLAGDSVQTLVNIGDVGVEDDVELVELAVFFGDLGADTVLRAESGGVFGGRRHQAVEAGVRDGHEDPHGEHDDTEGDSETSVMNEGGSKTNNTSEQTEDTRSNDHVEQ